MDKPGHVKTNVFYINFKSGLCRQQQKKLEQEVQKAWEHGTVIQLNHFRIVIAWKYDYIIHAIISYY